MEIRIKTQEEFRDAHLTIELVADDPVEAEDYAVKSWSLPAALREFNRRGESETHREEVIGLVRESDRLRNEIRELRTAADQAAEARREVTDLRTKLATSYMSVQELRSLVAERDKSLDQIRKAVEIENITDRILIDYFDPDSPGQDLADVVRLVRELLSSPSESTSQA